MIQIRCYSKIFKKELRLFLQKGNRKTDQSAYVNYNIENQFDRDSLSALPALNINSFGDTLADVPHSDVSETEISSCVVIGTKEHPHSLFTTMRPPTHIRDSSKRFQK